MIRVPSIEPVRQLRVRRKIGYPKSVEFEELVQWAEQNEPIMAMLLKEEAADVHEAEVRYLDSHLLEIVNLVESDLSD